MATSVFYMSPRTGIPRPRSANRANEEAIPTKTGLFPAPRCRADKDRLPPALKKPSIIPKRVNNTAVATGSKSIRTNVVQLTKKNSPIFRINAGHNEAIIREPKEMKQAKSDPSQFNKGDPSSQTDVIQLNMQYQENILQFENLKNELDDKQKKMLELYATLKQTHGQMSSLGHTAELPSSGEVRVLNVTDLTPEQLLNLCQDQAASANDNITNSVLSIDMNKINNMPNPLVSTCEQTLYKRKEIIAWLDSLVKSGAKGIKIHNLVGKVNEFTVENEMLNCSLEKVKEEFLKELNDVIDYLRKGVNETMQVHIRNEQLTLELVELELKNANLRKQLNTSENRKCNSYRAKLEELEKTLKEENCKKLMLRERLTRTEGQVKMGAEQAAHLQTLLEKSRLKIWSLEKTEQELHKENKRLQTDFETELNKLTESIKENSVNLEEIAEDREKLQTQKEELEKRIQQLSDYYNESLKNMKTDLKINIAKVIEAEKKYNAEIEERKKAEAKEESLSSQLRESLLRYTELCKNLEEKDNIINEAQTLKNELITTTKIMEETKLELDEYKTKLIHQASLICDIEHTNKELIKEKEDLKSQLNHKDKLITELEQKTKLIKEQSENNKSKMDSYEMQLASLRTQIHELQEEFGEFENLNELRQMVNQQRNKLLEATRQNGELAEALQNKDLKLEEQNKLLMKHDEMAIRLSEKEQEFASIGQMLRDNLESKGQDVKELNQRLIYKEEEVNSLSSRLAKGNQRISQLEKILLSFEDQSRKQRISYNEKIAALEKKIAEYQSYYADTQRTLETPPEHEAIDNLIKMIENELESPIDPQIQKHSKDLTLSRKNYIGDYNKNVKLENFTCNETNTNNIPSRDANVPTKIVMGNFVKKTYNISRNERNEKPGPKKAITNIRNPRKCAFEQAAADAEYQVYEEVDNSMKGDPMPIFKNFRDDRKYAKILKLAGHRM